MLTQDEILTMAQSSPAENKDKGADAFFVRLNKKWGLKYFKREIVRDNTYILQKMVHAIGLAPEIGTKIEFDMDDKHWYGYLTECVIETIGDYLKFHANYYGGQKWWDVSDMYQHTLPMREAVDNAYRGYLICNDYHNFNIGITETGELVFIDFSRWEVKIDGYHETAAFTERDFEEFFNDYPLHPQSPAV